MITETCKICGKDKVDSRDIFRIQNGKNCMECDEVDSAEESTNKE